MIHGIAISQYHTISLAVYPNQYNQKLKLQLEIEMTEKEIDGLSRGKEDVLVKHDVMKLEVKNRRDVLFSAADTLFTLENRKY